MIHPSLLRLDNHVILHYKSPVKIVTTTTTTTASVILEPTQETILPHTNNYKLVRQIYYQIKDNHAQLKEQTLKIQQFYKINLEDSLNLIKKKELNQNLPHIFQHGL